MNTTRAVLFVTVFVMLLSLMAGCIEVNPSEDTYTGGENPYDEGGPYLLTDESATLSLWTVFNPSSALLQPYDIAAISYAEAVTGVRIEFVTAASNNARDLFSARISSGDCTDIMQYVNVYESDIGNREGMVAEARQYMGAYDSAIGSVEKNGVDGVILDLGPYLEEYAPNYYALINSDEEIKKDVTAAGGAVVYFHTIKEEAIPTAGLFIRKDWLDELGLDIPVTYDDFYNVLMAFKAKYDPLRPFLLDTDLMGRLSGGFGTTYGYYQVDGVVRYGVVEEEYRDYVKEMNRWYEAGIISSDFVSNTGNIITDLVTPVIIGGTGIFYAPISYVRDFEEMAEDPDFSLVGIQYPVKNEGDVYHFQTTNSRVVSDGLTMAITTACKDVELAVRWCDFWYSEQGIDIWNYGIENETFVRNAGGKVTFTDLVINNKWGVSAEDALGNLTPYYLFFASCMPLERMTCFYTDNDMKTIENWSSGDNAYTLPESFQQDYTYSYGEILKFITGQLSLDNDWDDNIGIGESAESDIAYMQKLYDEYLEG